MPEVRQVVTRSVPVVQASPNTNFESALTMRAQHSTSGALQYSYFFANRPFPLGATILSARIEASQRGASTGGSRTQAVRPVTGPWQSDTVTFNRQPSFAESPAATVTLGNGPDGRIWPFDVTAATQLIADGAPYFGWRLSSDNTTLIHMYGWRSGENAPRWIVEYSVDPDTPSQLIPANGQAVSLARPTLVFGYAGIGENAVSAVQVQMNEDTAAFDSPDHDSGEVAATEHQYPVPFDIDPDAIWFWRVRVKNAAGEWSDWSEPVEFTRVVKPALAIVSPAESPDNVVTDPTPPFAWELDGDQTAYRVIVDGDLGPRQSWDTGRVAADTNVVTYPSTRAPIRPGHPYQLIVRVEDDVDRVATPGDPVWIEAVREFTFARVDTVAPPTGLAVNVVREDPRVGLSWSRGEMPDRWAIMRDGETVAVVDAAEVHAGGTSYEYVDRFASPRSEHTWSVAAIVNGETSDDNPTATGTTAPVGIWLMTTDGEHAICLGGDRLEMEPQEVYGLKHPLGGGNPILITQGIFGRLWRSRHAFLTDRRASSLAEQVAAWDAITDPELYPRGTPLSIVMSDTAIHGFIFDTARDIQTYTANQSDVSGQIDVKFRVCEVL